MNGAGSRPVGIIALVVGVLGVLLGIGLVWLGLFWVDGASDTLDEGLVLADESINAIAETVDVADATIGVTSRSLEEIQASLDVASGSFTRVDSVIGETSTIVSEDIARSVQGLLDTLPGLIDVGDALDVAMSSLTFLGVDYDPEQPIGDGFRDMRLALLELPEQLRGQGALLAGMRGDLEETRVGLEVLSEGITDIRFELDETRQLLERYRITADDGSDLIARMQRDVDAGAPIARLALVLGGLFLVLSQVLPVSMGWRMLRSDTTST